MSKRLPLGTHVSIFLGGKQHKGKIVRHTTSVDNQRWYAVHLDKTYLGRHRIEASQLSLKVLDDAR